MNDPKENQARRSRFAAALVMLAWLLASLAVLLLFRGMPARFRAYFVILTLLGLIWGIGAIRARWAK